MELDDRNREAHRMSQRLHFVGKGWDKESIQWVLEQIMGRYEARRKWEILSQFVKVEVIDLKERSDRLEEARMLLEEVGIDELEAVIKQFRNGRGGLG